MSNEYLTELSVEVEAHSARVSETEVSGARPVLPEAALNYEQQSLSQYLRGASTAVELLQGLLERWGEEVGLEVFRRVDRVIELSPASTTYGERFRTAFKDEYGFELYEWTLIDSLELSAQLEARRKLIQEHTEQTES